jgi:galactose-1-phosphate uridylyltransferase
MSPDEHFEYFRFTADSIQDIFESDRYVRYVVTFQNWLRPAGASFDHLHKQLVGLDDWGATLSMEVESSRKDHNFFNSMVVNFAGFNNLVIAENDHAVLFADLGHRHPTLAIFSKARHTRPFEHSPEELRSVSDLVHACHVAQGPDSSCNEEWYYQPRDCLDRIPFHVLIKWRLNNPAGFEGGTFIFINPLRPKDVRDEIVPKLFRLRAEGRIARNIRIAEECPVEPNSLKYNR